MNKSFEEYNDLKFLDTGKDELVLCTSSNYGCKVLMIEALEGNGERDYEKMFLERNKLDVLYSSTIGPISWVDMRCDKKMLAMIGMVDHQILNPRMLYVHKTEDDPAENEKDERDNMKSFCEIVFTEKKYLKDERVMFPTPIYQVYCAQNNKFMMVVLQNKIVALECFTLQFKGDFEINSFSSEKPIFSFADTKHKLLVAYVERSDTKEDMVKIGSAGEFKEFSFKIPRVGCMAFSNDGQLLATSEEDGKKIVVYSVDFNNETKEIVYKFTKSTSPSQITSIAFSNDKSLLSVCSDSKTTHVFKLGKENDYKKYNTYMSWSFPYSFLRIDFGTVPVTQSFSLDSKRLFVVTNENVLYQVSIPSDRTTVTRVEPKNFKIL